MFVHKEQIVSEYLACFLSKVALVWLARDSKELFNIAKI
jgi:hypothetical protein